MWHDQPAGRITASILKAACHTDPGQPSLSLIKAICYPHSVKFSTSATKWGCEHEKAALQEYEKFMIKTHDNYSCAFGKCNYRVLVSVSACILVCVCVCVCFSTITQKEIDLGTRNWNML